jgi:predicted Zn-dependent protease
MRYWHSIGIVSIIGTLMVSGCSNVPMTGRSRVVMMDESQLASLSATEYKTMLSQSKISTDPTGTAMLQRIAKRLVAATEELAKEHNFTKDLSVYQWEFTLIDEPQTINAFCMPGGKVVVYTGIMPIAENEEGLAVILAHEVAHAIAKHGNERMSQKSLVNAGGLLLNETLKTSPEETRQLFGGVYGLGTTLGVLLPYSRDHESEADHIGLILMKKAGYDPRAAIDFWKRMSAHAGGKSSPEFLSTHPSDETRIANIKAAIEKGL